MHIPFCPHICPYCDFTKTDKFSFKDIDVFIQKTLEQWEKLSPQYLSLGKEASLYFGGGTPSLLPRSVLENLVHSIKNKVTLKEFTIESNPFSNLQVNVKNYLELGCNRITLGAQALCDTSLHFLGRKHSREDILENIKMLRSLGYAQVQVDLIYGLPEHLPKRNLASEIKQCVEAGATGISAYHLTIEPRTQFKNVKSGPEENAAQEYLTILNTCEELGMIQFESSNFSFVEPVHNTAYWKGYPYLGLGTGAHGLLPPSTQNPYGQRYKVGEKLKEISPGNDEIKVTENYSRLFSSEYEPARSQEEYITELAFTLLRTKNGIPLSWIQENCGPEKLEKLILDLKVQRAISEKKIFLTKEALKLSSQEQLLADSWGSHIAHLL